MRRPLMQLESESPETYARQTIVHTLLRHPDAVWTREALANRFGIAPSLAGSVLTELVSSGIVRRLDGPDEEYAAAGADH
jgi:DNA-binding IscR family transcriptional regulator